MSSDLVKLNVGGVHYVTMRSTLTRYPDSMLAAMVSGSIPPTLDEDGRYFIDRNGALFGHVLDFLRTSQLALPDGFSKMHQLLVEADYYQIGPLLEALHEMKGWQQLRPSPPSGEILEVLEILLPRVTNEEIPARRTIISGRRDIINSLPSEIISRDTTVKQVSGPLYDGCMEYTHLDMMSKHIRVCLANFLLKNHWVLVNENMSTTSVDVGSPIISTKMTFRKSEHVQE